MEPSGLLMISRQVPKPSSTASNNNSMLLSGDAMACSRGMHWYALYLLRVVMVVVLLLGRRRQFEDKREDPTCHSQS